MPIYEFHCPACRQDCELLCRATQDLAALACEHCGATGLHKRISRFARGGAGGEGAGLDETGGPSSGHASGCASCAGGSCGSCSH